MQPLAGVLELRALTKSPWPDESQALLALRSASSVVRDYCGWPISRQENVEVELDSDGGGLLVLPTLHLTAVHQITDTDTDEALTGYRWSQLGLIHRAGQRWPAGFTRVRVRYDSGWEQPPEALAAVVCSLADRTGSPSAKGVASMTVGAQSVTYVQDGSTAAALSRTERVTLDRYRLTSI